MTDRQYLCVIGDLVDSRRIRDRADFQANLNRAMARINRGRHALSPWTLTLGDEFQTVFESETGFWEDILALMLAAWPRRIRFSIGIGSLSTPINRRQALGMDGPAFYLARSGVQALKDRKGFFGLRFETPPESAELLELFVSLVGKLLYQARTDTRIKVFRGLLADQSGKRIAEECGVSASAVSQQIETGALDELVGGVRWIESVWNGILNPPS